MPYADDAHAFWSGYFSSRMALKGYIRDSSAVFQAAKQIQVASTSILSPTGGPNPDDNTANPLYLLERAMGVTQHHDAVSGTSKQHVAYDYARRLAGGRIAADGAISVGLGLLTGQDAAATAWASCDLSNVTICAALEGGPTTMLIWNQQSQPLTNANIRIPVRAGTQGWTVRDGANVVLASQTSATSDADNHIRTEYYAYKTAIAAVEWLHFQLPNVPAVGYAVVYLTPGAALTKAASVTAAVDKAPMAFTTVVSVSNGIVNMTFGSDGRLSTLNGHVFSQDFFYYNSSTGGHNDGTGDWFQNSGAYVFRPNSSTAFPIAGGVVTAQVISSGPTVWQVRQTFGPWVSQSIRLWANSSEIEFEHTVGPIPINGPANPDGEGFEIISRYTSDIQSAGLWVSDANGRDALIRKRDSRKAFNYTVFEPVAGNFVPVNLFQTLSDGVSTLSVVVDRSQGGSSREDGK